MIIVQAKTPAAMGQAAAREAAAELNRCIKARGEANLLLSTGASQFDTLAALVQEKVDWTLVTMFHLDEYIGLPETHPASFRKYLKERVISKAPFKAVHLVDSTPDCIPKLTEAIRKSPIDLALIGIGENGHIAFNDPPADFDTDAAYIVVELNDTCKKQQVGEGWFATANDVPKQAITMTVRQIMRSRKIISCVPHAVKANAVRATIENKVTNRVPATVLKTHPNWSLYLDDASAAQIDEKFARAHCEGLTEYRRV